MSTKAVAKKRPKTAELLDDGERKLLFAFTQCGNYKQIFNTNCRCNVLLDAIRRDIVSEFTTRLNGKMALLRADIAKIQQQLDEARAVRELAEKKRAEEQKKIEEEAAKEAKKHEEANKKSKEKEGHEKGKNEAKDEAKDAKAKEAKVKEAKAKEEKKGKEAKKVKGKEKDDEEEADAIDSGLEEQKGKLVQEYDARVKDLDFLQHVTDIDLFDAEGAPQNLRSAPTVYAKAILRCNRVYSVVAVTCKPKMSNRSDLYNLCVV